MGRIRRAHGVRGEVVVELLTDAPEAIFAPGASLRAGTTRGDPSPDGARLTVEDARPFKATLLVTFAEIPDRTEAELWRDRYLLAPVDALVPLAEDEVYLHDLVGLRVEGADGTVLGRVEGYFELPHALLLEVRRPGVQGETVLLPYQDAFVVAVDVPGGRLVVAPPEGLF